MAPQYIKNLNKLELSAYAGCFAKRELVMGGVKVYSPEVDDHGTDFAIKRGAGRWIEVKVKSIRNKGYAYLPKDKFPLSSRFYLGLVIFPDGDAPALYLIPSLAWKKPNGLLVSRCYKGCESPPEWGVNISQKNMELLKAYLFNPGIGRIPNAVGGCTAT